MRNREKGQPHGTLRSYSDLTKGPGKFNTGKIINFPEEKVKMTAPDGHALNSRKKGWFCQAEPPFWNQVA